MKRYTMIFLAILLFMQAYAMDDSQNKIEEATLRSCPLSHHYATVLNHFDETTKHLYETSESCINRLAQCGHKLNYIKCFGSIDNLNQYLRGLDEYISSLNEYIHSLRQPDSAPHDASKLVSLVETMIKNAEEKKELAIARFCAPNHLSQRISEA